MITQETFDEITAYLSKQPTPEQIKAYVDAVRVVYETHMGKFPPVPDAVFEEIFFKFTEVSKADFDNKLKPALVQK